MFKSKKLEPEDPTLVIYSAKVQEALRGIQPYGVDPVSVLLLLTHSLEEGAKQMVTDGPRMALRINGVPIEELALIKGFDIAALNDAKTDEDVFKAAIINTIGTSLSKRHMQQLQSVYDQWLIGHIYVKIKNYFLSQMQTVFILSSYTNIYVEKDVLKMKSEVIFSHVIHNTTENITRLNAKGVTEATFYEKKGFIIEDFRVLGSEKERLAKIYELKKDDIGPTLLPLAKEDMKKYLQQ